MRKILLVAAMAFAGYVYFNNQHHNEAVQIEAPSSAPSQSEATAAATIDNAIANKKSKVQVSGQGVVVKLLPDDNQGSRHQKFIVKLATGETLLIAHNIDLASRIHGLNEGDPIQFHGEYEWNERGGVVHWTHKDPHGSHPSGWLQHQGETYQ